MPLRRIRHADVRDSNATAANCARTSRSGASPRIWLAFVLLSISIIPVALADAETDITDGIVLLGTGDYKEALQRFQAAGREVPDAPEPYFFAGAALNRIGQPRAALDMIERAVFLYASSPEVEPHRELDFERGWALLGLGRFEEATAALARYEQAYPGRGQTVEFLARAAVGRGEYADAERWFDEAVARDPALAETVALGRAASLEKQGDSAGARRELAALLSRDEGTRLNRLLAERIPPTAAQEAANYGITLSLGAGHNSNALGLSDDEPIASSSDAGEDNYQRFLMSGFYRWTPSDWAVTAQYSLQADKYNDVSDINQVDSLATLSVFRQITQRVAANVDVRDRYTRIANDGLLNEVSVMPVVAVSVTDYVSARITYTFSYGDYLTRSATPLLDRDNLTHDIGPGVSWSLPSIRSLVSLDYAHRFAAADGTDFDADADAGTLRLDSALPWRVTSRIVASYEHRDFDNPNSLSASGQVRDDDFYYASVFLQRSLGDVPGLSDRMRIYMQYDYLDRDSNLDFYSYHQHVFGAGIILAL